MRPWSWRKPWLGPFSLKRMADFAPTLSVIADFKGLDALVKNLDPELIAVVAIAAHNVERRAKDWVPVDTGATKNSILPRFSEGGMVAEIGPTTAYAPFLEFGTRFMAARPFMIPALEAERQPFLTAIAQLIEKAANG